MTPEFRSLLFTIFAPITVPVYVLFLALANLFGGAYYIVVEASLARITRKPISLTKTQLLIFSLPVLVAAPFALAIHLILAAGRAIVSFLRWVGRWQADVQHPWLALIPGAVWTLVAFWVTLTCLDAADGVRLIGRGIPTENVDRLVLYGLRPQMLSSMPPAMQAQRRELIEAFKRSPGEDIDRDWEYVTRMLSEDDSVTTHLGPITMQRLADVPWFYSPAEFSQDGLDRSRPLLGPLLFAWILLFRWPGMFAVLSRRWLRVAWCFIRVFIAGAAIFHLVAWEPMTPWVSHYFPDPIGDGLPAQIPAWFKILSPAFSLGINYEDYARPEWALLNAALWLAIAGIVIFVWWLGWRLSSYLAWPRYYVAFLASRLLQRKRIAFFSVGAVTLCVAMMIIVKSVMGGFVDSIGERAKGLLGHLVMDGSLQGFPYYEEFIEEVMKLRDEKTGKPIVAAASPIIHTYGLIQFPNTKQTEAVTIRGIDLDTFKQVNRFGDGLYYSKRFGPVRLDVELGQPVFGRGKDGRVALPGSMDEYYKNVYLPSLSPEERIEHEKRYARFVDETFFPGPGRFGATTATDFSPQYEGKPALGAIIGSDVIFDRLPSGEYDRESTDIGLGEPVFITMVTISRSGDLVSEPPPKVLFRYVDDSRTGIHEIDSKSVYIDFKRAQELLMMGPQERTDGTMTSPRAYQVQIRLHDEFAASARALQASKKRVNDVWRRIVEEANADSTERSLMLQVGFSTWNELQSKYIAAIQKEEVLVLIMFGVISLVAIFLILCIFYMIVQEKTRDVGIIKSVGGSTEGIAAVFLVYGAAIGLVGCILGSLLGTTFVTYINDVQDFLARLSPELRIWNPETYSFDRIPSHWKMSEVLWISALAVVASILGATIPALKAGKTWPVESLRYE